MDILERHISTNSKREAVLHTEAEKYVRKVVRAVNARDYTKSESSLAAPFDVDSQKVNQKLIDQLSGAKHVVLIGIGGSSLGAEALYKAVALSRHAKLHVLDAIELDALEQLAQLLTTLDSPDELAVCIVSKSGNTTETITNASEFIAALTNQFGKEALKRVVCIGMEDSEFIKNAKKQKVLTATFPETIGGRFSVFTAVGQIPLALCGLDVASFYTGAQEAFNKTNRDGIISQATKLVELAEQGVHTVNFFTFNERLRTLGYWYRQLLAESIGKNMTTDGTTFSHQLLPTVATSVDLHSMAQLYLGGYKGMYTHFVYGDVESDFHKVADTWLMEHMADLRNHTPQEIKNTIRKGVLQAYDDQKLPYRYTHLHKITAYEVGYLMASLMLEVMILGALFKVDVFNQPSVELYKKHTRKLLKEKGKSRRS